MRRFAWILMLAPIAGCHDHWKSDDDDRTFTAWPTDFNRDGFADLLVGAPLEDAGGANAGRVHVYAGSTGVDTTADVTYTGAEAGGNFGAAVAAIGDFNGDTFPDFAIGAPGENGGAGRVYVYYGGSGFPAAPSLTLNGTEAGGSFGAAVARAGDFNGDGRDDLLVGAPLEDAGGADRGRAYLFTVGSGATPLLTFSGGENASRFGGSVDTAGDLNGDTIFDIAVGAPGDDDDGNTTDDAVNRGRVYVYFGSGSPDNSVDRVFAGAEAGAEFGASVAGLLDYNSDGFGDLAVGAPRDDGDGNTVEDGIDAGRAFVFFGSASVDTGADRTMTGVEAGGRFGGCVARIGDVNSGGAPDLLVGAPFDDADGNTTDSGADRGRAFLFWGGTFNDTTVDLTLSGAEDGSHFGSVAFSGGDLNGDGHRDIVTGAPDDDNDGNATENGVDAGVAFVFFGGPSIDNTSDRVLVGTNEAGARHGASTQ